MSPTWLHALSILSLVSGGLAAVVVAVDVARHPQRMWIMDVVWPVVALFGGPLALWGYVAHGRQAGGGGEEAPFPVAVGKAAAHCGAGCTLGDICAEWLAFGFPAILAWRGWTAAFPQRIFAVWVLDYLLAFAFGIAFQYFTIAPMRHLGVARGLVQAVKADALSLSAWQLGMYGWMGVADLFLFPRLLGTSLTVASVEFWFMMQIAMLFGFATAYPVNWWLVASGIKERM